MNNKSERIELAANLAAILRQTGTREGLLKLIGDMERRSRSALAGKFTDADPNPEKFPERVPKEIDLSDPERVVSVYLQRGKWPPTVAAHVEVLRACLAIRECESEFPESLRDWLLDAVRKTDDPMRIGRRRGAIAKHTEYLVRIIEENFNRTAKEIARLVRNDPMSPFDKEGDEDVMRDTGKQINLESLIENAKKRHINRSDSAS